MLYVETFVFNPVSENTYVVYDETLEAVVIDCGAFSKEEEFRLEKFISEKQLKLKYALFTHGHFDHVFGNSFLYNTYHLSPLMHQADEKIYHNSSKLLSSIFHQKMDIQTVPISEYLKEGMTIAFGTHCLEVIETPGHTPGGVCFLERKEKKMFCGDSIFFEEVGRCDLEGGSFTALREALCSKVLSLPEDIELFPGHGMKTTIGHEKQNNPYLQ